MFSVFVFLLFLHILFLIFIPTPPEFRGKKKVKMIYGVSCLSLSLSLRQHEDGGRRSMMGDSSKLLTHYHDDAKTMYEVFQRGLHISGGYDVRWDGKHLLV